MGNGLRYLLALAAVVLLGACDKYNYTDPLQDIGKRVETIEEMELRLNGQIEALNAVIAAIESDGYVTSVKTSTDGTYLITFNDGHTVTLRPGRDGKDGRDGKEADLMVSVEQDASGTWFWVVNGVRLTDENGNPVPVTAQDGKDGRDGTDGRNGRDGVDGKDGRDGHDGIDGRDGKDGKALADQDLFMPQVRINDTTRNWEISYDGGRTWFDTGICADGKDGQDDLFIGVKIVEGGKAITFYLRDGRTFTVPIM